MSARFSLNESSLGRNLRVKGFKGKSDLACIKSIPPLFLLLAQAQLCYCLIFCGVARLHLDVVRIHENILFHFLLLLVIQSAIRYCVGHVGNYTEDYSLCKFPLKINSIGHVIEYPTMNYFGIPRHARSTKAYKILTEYFWRFQ